MTEASHAIVRHVYVTDPSRKTLDAEAQVSVLVGSTPCTLSHIMLERTKGSSHSEVSWTLPCVLFPRLILICVFQCNKV